MGTTVLFKTEQEQGLPSAKYDARRPDVRSMLRETVCPPNSMHDCDVLIPRESLRSRNFMHVCSELCKSNFLSIEFGACLLCP